MIGKLVVEAKAMPGLGRTANEYSMDTAKIAAEYDLSILRLLDLASRF